MGLYNRLNPDHRTPEVRVTQPQPEANAPRRIPEWRRRALARVEADGGNFAVNDLTGDVRL